MGGIERGPPKKPISLQERKDRKLLDADPRFRRHPDLGRFSFPDIDDFGLVRQDPAGGASGSGRQGDASANVATVKALTDVILYSFAPDNKLDAVKGILVVLRGAKAPKQVQRSQKTTARPANSGDAESVRLALGEILAPLMAVICSEDGTGELPHARSPSLPHGAEAPELPKPSASIDDATKATIVSLKSDACEVLSLLLKSPVNQKRFRERGCLRMLPSAVQHNPGPMPRLHLAEILQSLVGNPENFDAFEESGCNVLQILLSLSDTSKSTTFSDTKLQTIKVAARAVQELSKHTRWLEAWPRDHIIWAAMLSWLGSGEKSILDAGVSTMINLTRHDGANADLIVNTNMQGTRLRGHKLRYKYFGGELLLSYLANENSDFEEIEVAETADEASRDNLGELLLELSQYPAICEALIDFGVLPILLSNFRYPHASGAQQAERGGGNGKPDVLVVNGTPDSRPGTQASAMNSTGDGRASPSLWSPRSGVATAPRTMGTFRAGTRWVDRAAPPRYGKPVRLGGPPLMPPEPPRPGTAAARFSYVGHERVRPKPKPVTINSEPNLRRYSLAAADNMTRLCPDLCVKEMLDLDYLSNALETLESLDVRARRSSASIIFDMMMYNNEEFLALGEPHIFVILKRATNPDGDPTVKLKMIQVALTLFRKNEALMDRIGMSGDRNVERYIDNMTLCVESKTASAAEAEKYYFHLLELVLESIKQSSVHECISTSKAFADAFARFKKSEYPENIRELARELDVKVFKTRKAVANASLFWINKVRMKMITKGGSAFEGKAYVKQKELAIKKLAVDRLSFFSASGTFRSVEADLSIRQCVD